MGCVDGRIAHSYWSSPLHLYIARVSLPDRLQRSLWPTIMQKCHIHIRDGLAVIGDGQAVIVGKSAEDADLDLLDGANLQQLIHICRWHSQHHTFLSF